MTHAAPKTAAIWWPNQRAWRTALQTIASSILSIAAFIAGLSILAPQFVAALEPILPADWYVWLLGAVTFIGLLSATLARMMAIPGVNEWLIRHSAFGTAPRGQLTTATINSAIPDATSPQSANVTPGMTNSDLAALAAAAARARTNRE